MNEVLLLSMTYLAAVIPAAMAQPNEHALFKNSDVKGPELCYCSCILMEKCDLPGMPLFVNHKPRRDLSKLTHAGTLSTGLDTVPLSPVCQLANHRL